MKPRPRFARLLAIAVLYEPAALLQMGHEWWLCLGALGYAILNGIAFSWIMRGIDAEDARTIFARHRQELDAHCEALRIAHLAFLASCEARLRSLRDPRDDEGEEWKRGKRS